MEGGDSMVSIERLSKICEDIYIEMFKESTPSADFYKLIELGVTKQPGWFLNYYLNDDNQQDIIKRHCKKNNLNSREERLVRVEVTLGCSPKGRK